MLGYDWPRLHALLNDFPSALLAVAVLFDLLGTLTRRPNLRQVGFWTLVVGALGAVLAVVSGLQAEDHIAHGRAVHEVMEEHERLALITLAVFGVLALWRIFRESRMGNGERLLALGISLAGLGLLVATGRHGGELMFDHAAGIRTEVLQAELRDRSSGHEHKPGESHAHPEPADVAEPVEHIDPPGTPPHTHEDANPDSHSHPVGTPPHSH